MFGAIGRVGREGVAPDEVGLVEVDEPTEADVERVRLAGVVVDPVEHEAGLDPQPVDGGHTEGRDVGGDERVVQGADLVRVREELVAQLAAVAGAGEDAARTGERDLVREEA